MAAITVDTRDLEKMTAFLRKNSKSGGAVAIATQQTLNGLAFEARKLVVDKYVLKTMTVRTKAYTRMSMRVEKVPRGKKITQMESKVGALEKKGGKTLLGWKESEEGKTVRSPYRGRHGYHATRYARGGTLKGKVRTRHKIANMNAIMSPRNYVKNPAENHRALQVQMIAAVIKNKERRPFYLTVKGEKGIYEVRSKQLRKIYAIGKKKYPLKKRKWLSPSSNEALFSAEKLYSVNAQKQIERLSKKLGIKYSG